LEKIIRNVCTEEAPGVERTPILEHDVHPEGLDVDRVRVRAPAKLTPDAAIGQIWSLVRGAAALQRAGEAPLKLEGGTHLYLPLGLRCTIEAQPGAEWVRIRAPKPEQARGKQLLLRDETFVSACAVGERSLRWTLTPQYLSRRIFLHHDPALLSRSGNPVSWFHTTMFDVAGLPANEQGEPVFKMSYNSRTEFNTCYEVEGIARVRMALHPYQARGQRWGEWQPVDGESTYHLNEPAGGPDEERFVDASGRARTQRNKHEVDIRDGYVSLFCLFDPAPVGIERHRPGEYSDYEPLSDVMATEDYAHHQREIRRFDEMVDSLSMAKARGELSACFGTAAWEQYLRGRQEQAEIEKKLIARLVAEGQGRERILKRWLQPAEPLI
jgi:hypothetical protein